jgi:small subunit ribosomal protein S3Ae
MSQKSKRKRRPKAKKVSYKDKSWFTCFAPKSFNYKELGQVIGFESNVIGRTIDNLLFDFTDDYNDINLKLKFKTTDVNPETKKCSTMFIGHEYTSDFVRSLVGRGSTKITSIENFTTKDEFVYRLTTVAVTIRRARSSQQILIRRIMRDVLREFAKSLNHEKFIKGIIEGEFERQIERIAKTIYPLSDCKIIKSKLISVPEGGEDKEVPDSKFDIVEIDVERSRKSEIKRSERVNVKKLAQQNRKQQKSEKEEEDIDEEDLEEIEEEDED